MLLKDFIRTSRARLESIYPAEEAGSIVSILCQEKLGVRSWTHITEPGTEIPDGALSREMDELASGRPLQYVLGCTEFCGRKFKVGPGVLIPRPETEQLVSLSEQAIAGRRSCRVLDLCTGSGCIAWSVALDIPGTEVRAVDVSAEALAIAASQFGGFALPENCLKPEFVREDILAPLPDGAAAEWDLIVSNPPYIMDSEKAAMRSNVLDWEPELALFVPDSDPLLFYRAIATRAAAVLVPGGTVVVEINEKLGDQTVAVFESAGLVEIAIIKDFFGKNRFVKARKK